MQVSEPILPVYDMFCHHRGNVKYLLVLKSIEPSRLKTALILYVNFPTCYCFIALKAPLHGRVKRPLVRPQERFAKYFSGMLYTGFSIPVELPRHLVMESIYENWHYHVQELRQFYSAYLGDAVPGIELKANLSTSNAVQRGTGKQLCVAERKESSSDSTDDSDSDALCIDESADSADEEDDAGPHEVSVEDGIERFGGQQGAKLKAKSDGDKGTTQGGDQNSAKSADGKSSLPFSAMWSTMEPGHVVDQKVQLMFQNYLEFMIDYAAEKSLRKITLFEMTTREPPNMRVMTQNRKRKCTYQEKDHLFEDED